MRAMSSVLLVLASSFFGVCNAYETDFKNAYVEVLWYGRADQRVKMIHLKPDRPSTGTFFSLPGKGSAMSLRAWFFQRILDLGWEVYSLDWREQGESDRCFSQPEQIDIGHNGFEDYVGDALELVSWARENDSPHPWVMFGSSLGGHIGLRVLEEQQLFDGAIFQAPLCEPKTGVYPLMIAKPIVKLLNWCGISHVVAPGQSSVNPLMILRQKAETNEYARQTVAYYEEFPERYAWKVTLGWVNALFDSCALAMEPDRIRRVNCPALVLVATQDQVVSPAACHVLADLLPQGRAIEFECGHNINAHSNEVKEAAFEATTEFLDRVLQQHYIGNMAQ